MWKKNLIKQMMHVKPYSIFASFSSATPFKQNKSSNKTGELLVNASTTVNTHTINVYAYKLSEKYETAGYNIINTVAITSDTNTRGLRLRHGIVNFYELSYITEYFYEGFLLFGYDCIK